MVSAAIGLRAHAEVRLGGAGLRLTAEDLGAGLEVANESKLAPRGPLSLLQAGLRMLPVGPCALVTRSDAPPGSGLGSSGALGVALVGALTSARAETRDMRAVAELACRLERLEAGIPGGRQDQFSAAIGGSAFGIRKRRSRRWRWIPRCSASSSAECCWCTPARRASPARRSAA